MLNLFPLYVIHHNSYVGYYADKIISLKFVAGIPGVVCSFANGAEYRLDYSKLYIGKFFCTRAINKIIQREYLQSVANYSKENVKLAERLKGYGLISTESEYHSLCADGIESPFYQETT